MVVCAMVEEQHYKLVAVKNEIFFVNFYWCNDLNLQKKFYFCGLF